MIKYYSIPDNFADLSNGSFGKLNYQYTVKVLLECKSEFDDYVLLCTRRLLAKQGKNKDEVLTNLILFIKQQYIDVTKLRSIKERKGSFDYNILAWKKDLCLKPIEGYVRAEQFSFTISDDHRKAINKVYSQFKQKDLNLTLRKMIEYMNLKDLFYEVNYE